MTRELLERAIASSGSGQVEMSTFHSLNEIRRLGGYNSPISRRGDRAKLSGSELSLASPSNLFLRNHPRGTSICQRKHLLLVAARFSNCRPQSALFMRPIPALIRPLLRPPSSPLTHHLPLLVRPHRHLHLLSYFSLFRYTMSPVSRKLPECWGHRGVSATAYCCHVDQPPY